MLNYFGNLQCINTVLNVISQTLAHTSLSSLNPNLERDLVNSALSFMRLVTSAIFRTPLRIINKNYLHLYINYIQCKTLHLIEHSDHDYGEKLQESAVCHGCAIENSKGSRCP